MTETTEETYEVDGVVLNTYASNLQTLTGRSSTPPLKGENVEIPYRRGRRWEPKAEDEKVETWTMWVVGADADGMVPPEGARAQFNANLLALKRLFGVRHRQLALVKKLRFPDGLREFSALGEVTGAIEPTVGAAGTRAVFSVDMTLADPFWYGEEVTETIAPMTATTVENPGTAAARDLAIRLIGPLTNPRILRSTDPEIQVRYQGLIASGSYVDLDVGNYLATDDLGNNVVGRVSHAGSLTWMELLPGENDITLDSWTSLSSPGAGSAQIVYRPPYT